jgi:hypothetical protein
LWYNIPIENCAPAKPGRFSFGSTGFSLCSFQSAIPKLNSKETFMSSLSPKDRVSLCSFTFSDGRRCRTPRAAKHPRFCFYHAQKEARARTAQKLGKDLAYFFSGDYLSACDLSSALARLIPAVVRGDVKSKTAHTVAYLVQTLMQAIHISQHEYINAFGTDGWRKSVRNSVNGNYDYRFPPDPDPEQPALSALRTNLRSESPQPQPAVQPITAPQAAETPLNCHSERSADFALRENLRSEESAFSESQADLSQIIPAPQQAHSSIATKATQAAPAYPACHPEHSDTGPPTPPPAPNRHAYALDFDRNCRLLIDGKPL